MSERTRELDRRAVLRRIAAVSAATTATLTPTTDATAYNPGPDETRTRYQETAHVKSFYRTNGYETLKR